MTPPRALLVRVATFHQNPHAWLSRCMHSSFSVCSSAWQLADVFWHCLHEAPQYQSANVWWEAACERGMQRLRCCRPAWWKDFCHRSAEGKAKILLPFSPAPGAVCSHWPVTVLTCITCWNKHEVFTCKDLIAIQCACNFDLTVSKSVLLSCSHVAVELSQLTSCS